MCLDWFWTDMIQIPTDGKQLMFCWSSAEVVWPIYKTTSLEKGFHKEPDVPSWHDCALFSTVCHFTGLENRWELRHQWVKGQRSVQFDSTNLENDLNLEEPVEVLDFKVKRGAESWSRRWSQHWTWFSPMSSPGPRFLSARFVLYIVPLGLNGRRHGLSSQNQAGHPHKCTLWAPLSITITPQFFPSRLLHNSLGVKPRTCLKCNPAADLGLNNGKDGWVLKIIACIHPAPFWNLLNWSHNFPLIGEMIQVWSLTWIWISISSKIIRFQKLFVITDWKGLFYVSLPKYVHIHGKSTCCFASHLYCRIRGEMNSTQSPTDSATTPPPPPPRE